MNVPTRHMYDQVVDYVKHIANLPDVQFHSKLADRGYPGPCAIVQALDGFLEENDPQPGDVLASVVAESSKWMYGGFVLEYAG